jgi:hypothetical protein
VFSIEREEEARVAAFLLEQECGERARERGRGESERE